jgi:hypothetical protein
MVQRAPRRHRQHDEEIDRRPDQHERDQRIHEVAYQELRVAEKPGSKWTQPGDRRRFDL